MKSLSGKVARAIKDYQMIPRGATIGVALSGGKDSIALLYILKGLQQSLQFQLYPIHAKVSDYDTTILSDYCKQLKLPYTELSVPLDYSALNKKECFVCSRFIKGYITKHLKDEKIKTVAFGHHADDVAATFFINLTNHNKIGAFLPVLSGTKSGVDTIRPLIYNREKELENLVREKNLPLLDYHCPYAKNNIRWKLKEKIAQLETVLNCTNLPQNIYTALQSSAKAEFWN